MTDAGPQKQLGTAMLYGTVIVLAYLAYRIFDPFLVPLAWAAVLVVVSYPAYESLERRWGRTRAALACTVAVTLILIVPVLFVMVAFVREGVSAVQEIHVQAAVGRYTHLDDLWARLQQRFPEAGLSDLDSTLRHYGALAAEFIGARIGTIAKNLAVFFFHLGVTILAMFYLYRDGGVMVARLRELLPFDLDHRDRMLTESRNLIFASVTSSLAAAAAHGLLGGLAFAVTGVKAALFWGVMMGFFSFVPLVGSALIWVPVSIGVMAGGHTVRGILLILFCALIVSSVDNVIRPWLISGRAEMGGLMVFIGVLGGIAAFGLLGVVLGPIIVAMLASLLEVYAPTRARAGNKAVRADAK